MWMEVNLLGKTICERKPETNAVRTPFLYACVMPLFARIFNRFLWSEIPIAGDFPSHVRASILQGS
jgi:hypothetical protein